MIEYLKRLKWPDELKDFIDIFSKTVVAAMSAVIAAGVWWYSQHEQAIADLKKAEAGRLEHIAQDQQRQFNDNLQSLRLALSQNTDKRDNITLFLEVLPRDQTDPMWKVKMDSLSEYCVEELNDDKKKNPPLLSMLCNANSERGSQIASKQRGEAESAVQAAVNSGDASAYINSSAATTQVAGLAAVEAADTTASGGQWYAVLASVPLTRLDAAVAVANALNAKIGAVVGACDVHIYETRISRSFAITSGGPKTEAIAKARVRVVRQAGLSTDAFAQPDKGWVLSTRATQPKWSSQTPCG